MYSGVVGGLYEGRKVQHFLLVEVKADSERCRMPESLLAQSFG